HQYFRLGPRNEGPPIDLERPAVKLALSEQIRDWFGVLPARYQRLERGALRVPNPPLWMRQQLLARPSCDVLQQQTRVDALQPRARQQLPRGNAQAAASSVAVASASAIASINGSI